MQVNPKTQAVIDAFLDEMAPASLRQDRRAKLKSERPELFGALEDLVNAVQGK